MICREIKRVTLFCGHYGSGKTSIAVQYARELKKEGKETAFADLDIVNPYFRGADSGELMKSEGIEVVALPFANSNIDLPALPSEVYSLAQRRDKYAVFDIGGDDRGAYALGRFTPYILEENNYNMLFVVNFCRPLTQTAAAALEVMREIELACGIAVTGIVNNTNLGRDTTAELVDGSREEAERLALTAGVPLYMTSVKSGISAAGEDIFAIELRQGFIL